MISYKLLFVLLATVLMFLAPAIHAQCKANKYPCQPDGRTNCCSGFCYKEATWIQGYCENRQ